MSVEQVGLWSSIHRRSCAIGAYRAAKTVTRTKHLLQLHDGAVSSQSVVNSVLDIGRVILLHGEVVALGLDLVGLCNIRHAGLMLLEVAKYDFKWSHSRV